MKINVQREIWKLLHKLEQDAFSAGDAAVLSDIKSRKTNLETEMSSGKGLEALIPIDPLAELEGQNV